MKIIMTAKMEDMQLFFLTKLGHSHKKGLKAWESPPSALSTLLQADMV
uniref:Uncharacterized protein n=1 Tax=Rhizophora mucronata TaxID=61149 RepID=A0A2P2QPR5_RHIMU